MPGKWCPSAPNEKTITPMVSASTPTQGDCSKKTTGIISRGVATKRSKSSQKFKIHRPDAGRTVLAAGAAGILEYGGPHDPSSTRRPDGQQQTLTGEEDIPSSRSFNFWSFPRCATTGSSPAGSPELGQRPVYDRPIQIATGVRIANAVLCEHWEACLFDGECGIRYPVGA